MKKGLILLLAVIVLIAGSQFIRARHRLTAARADVDAAWVRVNDALEHRASAVTDLVEFMSSGIPQESNATRALSDARSALLAAHGSEQRIRANQQLDFALAGLLLTAEKYPKLERGKHFSEVVDLLKEAEYRIAVERRKYNEAVEHYNMEIALFPNNVVAHLSGFRKIDVYFQTPVDPPR